VSNRNFVEVKEIEREVNYYGAIDSRPIKESDIKAAPILKKAIH